MTDQEVEKALWDQTIVEDDPWFEVYLRSQKARDLARPIYLRWWEEKYGNDLYYTYCLKYRIWHPSSQWHPNSPWSKHDRTI